MTVHNVMVTIVIYISKVTSSSVVGRGTMLQAGRSRVPSRWAYGFFNRPNPSSRTMALGSTQSLTEMSTTNIPGSKGRPARKADNLTATCEPIVQKIWGILDVSQPYGPPWTGTGIASPLYTHFRWANIDHECGDSCNEKLWYTQTQTKPRHSSGQGGPILGASF
jgi:hypothetical protein